MPDCVRSLSALDVLAMRFCSMLTSIEHPPPTLRILAVYSARSFPSCSLLRKVKFDPEMSPLDYRGDLMCKLSSYELDGMVKIQPMTTVEEKIVHNLGWTNLEFLKKRHVGAFHFRGEEGCQTQVSPIMYYEFGIFSTIYEAKDMPDWIRCRSKGSSISFTIPSSPKKLRGLNFCSVETHKGIPIEKAYHVLPAIKISNMTKSRSWIFKHYLSSDLDCSNDFVRVGGTCLTYLSHWMFGMNEMETGDHVTITVLQDRFATYTQETSECGVRVVYDDGKIEEVEEDELSYYKSWNHIIGGDLLFSNHHRRIYPQFCQFLPVS